MGFLLSGARSIKHWSLGCHSICFYLPDAKTIIVGILISDRFRTSMGVYFIVEIFDNMENMAIGYFFTRLKICLDDIWSFGYEFQVIYVKIWLTMSPNSNCKAWTLWCQMPIMLDPNSTWSEKNFVLRKRQVFSVKKIKINFILKARSNSTTMLPLPHKSTAPSTARHRFFWSKIIKNQFYLEGSQDTI